MRLACTGALTSELAGDIGDPAATPTPGRPWAAGATGLLWFLCTDLRRQLYTLTGWIQRNDFSPVYNANRRAQDALVANRALSGAVTDSVFPGGGRNRGPAVVSALPDFVHTKGTLFLLYPGRTMLQVLAAAA